MIKRILIPVLLILSVAAPLKADFDERNWEYYSPVTMSGGAKSGLGSVYLERTFAPESITATADHG